MYLDVILPRLDEIKKQIDEQKDDPKVVFYLQSLQELLSKTKIDFHRLSSLKNNIELERKTLKNILERNSPTFIRYDNIYKEMITLIKFLLIYRKEE